MINNQNQRMIVILVNSAALLCYGPAAAGAAPPSHHQRWAALSPLRLRVRLKAALDCPAASCSSRIWERVRGDPLPRHVPVTRLVWSFPHVDFALHVTSLSFSLLCSLVRISRGLTFTYLWKAGPVPPTVSFSDAVSLPAAASWSSHIFPPNFFF